MKKAVNCKYYDNPAAIAEWAKQYEPIAPPPPSCGRVLTQEEFDALYPGVVSRPLMAYNELRMKLAEIIINLDFENPAYRRLSRIYNGIGG